MTNECKNNTVIPMKTDFVEHFNTLLTEINHYITAVREYEHGTRMKIQYICVASQTAAPQQYPAL